MLKIFGTSLNSNFCLSILRGMSVYPRHFVEPIVSRRRLEDMKNTEEFVKLSHIPIKAAKNDESASIFYNELINKMTNYVTKGGNKNLARDLLVQSFECIKRIQIERSNLGQNVNNQEIICNPEQLLILAIENSRPLLQLTAIKRGGVKYQVPIPVTTKRSYFLAMKWLLEAGREKEKKVHFPQKFAWEVLDAAYGQGRVIKKKNDLHRQCEANRAYAHYRWS